MIKLEEGLVRIFTSRPYLSLTLIKPMRSHLPPAPQFDRLGHQQLPAPPVVVPKWPLHSDFSPWPQKEIMRNQSKKRKSQDISQSPQKPSANTAQQRTQPENKRLKVEDSVGTGSQII